MYCIQVYSSIAALKFTTPQYLVCGVFQIVHSHYNQMRIIEVNSYADATSGQGAVHAVSSHEEEETDQMKSMQTESSREKSVIFLHKGTLPSLHCYHFICYIISPSTSCKCFVNDNRI